MSSAWLAVALVGAATIAIRASGPVLLGAGELPARLSRVLDLLGPAVLAALVATSAFAADERLVLDERAAGLAAAGAALAARAPLLAAAGAAAAVTALLRLL